MKYVFIIGTEHQFFQVQAAIKHFKLSEQDILLVILELDSDIFTQKIKNTKQFILLRVFKNWVFKNLFFDRKKHKEFIEFCYNLKKDNLEYLLFSSHYDSDPDLLFLSIVKPFKYYVMDEGTASFTVKKQRSEGNNKRLIFFIKSILYGNIIELPKKVIYFTKYNIISGLNDQIEKYAVKRIDNPLVSLNKKESIFIGTSAVEVGMMSIEEYLSLLGNIYSQINDTKCYYYPHRKESSDKLKTIEQIGYVINRIEEPFESMFEKQTECPSLFCSFFTTGVLDNISKSNKHIPHLRIYKFDTKLLLFDRDVYQEIYDEMQTNERLEFVEI